MAETVGLIASVSSIIDGINKTNVLREKSCPHQLINQQRPYSYASQNHGICGTSTGSQARG